MDPTPNLKVRIGIFRSLCVTQAQATVTFGEACSPTLLKCLENITPIWVESVFALPCLKQHLLQAKETGTVI